MALLPDIIQAGAIELCRPRPETVDDVLKAVESSYPELHHWLSWAQVEPTREWLLGVLEEDQANFEADEHWAFTLRENERGKVAGCAALHTDPEVGTLIIGYWVRTECTGRGYASAAVRALTDAAFQFLPEIERIRIDTDQSNFASVAVARGAGYQLVGEVDREVLAPGHSGRGLLWATERSSWT